VVPDESPTPQEQQEEQQDEARPESSLLHWLAVAMFALPVVGILFHAFIYATVPPWSNEYLRGTPIKIVAAVSFVNLVGNWFHYRRTRMNLDIFARILTYLWILTIVLLVVHWKP
jgi:hypothetical protein